MITKTALKTAPIEEKMNPKPLNRDVLENISLSVSIALANSMLRTASPLIVTDIIKLLLLISVTFLLISLFFRHKKKNMIAMMIQKQNSGCFNNHSSKLLSTSLLP
jgi:hypothetical protein